MCEGCGLKPQAYPQRRWCYDCKPGSKGRPLPCRRCGSTGNYWSVGLCRRCHLHAPQLPESCRDCLAWGVPRTLKWLCAACAGWRNCYPETAECLSCHRVLALNPAKACRLCWTQTFRNQARYGLPRDVLAANTGGQQLWFANLAGTRNNPQRDRRDYRSPRDQPPHLENGRPPEHTSAAADPPNPDQLDLFAYHPVESPARRFGFGDPPNGALARDLDRLTLEHAQRHGWSAQQTTAARITLRVAQARHDIRQPPISETAIHQLQALGLSTRMALLVLEENDLLLHDRPAPLKAWFARHVAALPEPMASEMRTWFDVLHDGSTTAPRSHPRQDVTIKTRTVWAMPTLRAWAQSGHSSLREITREDVTTALPPRGTPRVTLGVALRSIFTTLKGHRVLFINPMTGMNIGNLERRTPMPLDPARIRAVLHSPDPATAAIATLIGIHGLRPGETCALLLADVRGNRIFLPDRIVLLAPTTRTTLDAYLTDRRAKWPNSINAHLLIHTRSAPTRGPVQVPWLTDKLGFAASTLRRDRMLAEVHAGSDLRLLCDLFGVTIATAEHYASTMNHPDLDAPLDAFGWRTHRSD